MFILLLLMATNVSAQRIYDGTGRFMARTEGLTQQQIVLFFYFYY